MRHMLLVVSSYGDCSNTNMRALPKHERNNADCQQIDRRLPDILTKSDRRTDQIIL
jgi:hypothetical protein